MELEKINKKNNLPCPSSSGVLGEDPNEGSGVFGHLPNDPPMDFSAFCGLEHLFEL